MAAPMIKAIIFVFSFFLHSDFVRVHSKQLTSRDHSLVFVQESSFFEFSPFIHNHRNIRSVGLNYNLSPRNKRALFSNQQRRITIPENKSGVIYQFSDTSRSYVLVRQSVPDLLVMSGNSLQLANEKKFDFEDTTHRTITVVVNGTKNVNDVVQTTLTITVTNVNDEHPVFKNQPVPFLATVSANTPANVMVYEVYAEDTDPNSNVTYALESGGEGRFRLETSNIYDSDLGANIKVGRILTEGQGQFIEGKRYKLVIVAQDVSINPPQRTLKKVEVLVGVRPPQFYENPYHGSVLENNGIDQTLQNQLKVKAKPFQENTVITYQLYDENNATSNKFRIDNDGTVRTLQKLDYESVPRQQRPPVYKLQIRATESVTNLVTSADLIVTVMDDNDNNPVFDLSRYTQMVKEDLPIGREVMKVTATDDDDGTNAELVYGVNNDHFSVETVRERDNWVGIIKVKQELDYDEVPGHLYTFDITAKDKGVPIRSGTAKIRVFTTNVNDNAPELQIPANINLQENTVPGTVVTLLNAIDLDGDNFNYYFSPQQNNYEIFEIISDSGLIKTTKIIPKSVNHYVLNITMIDDGTCCVGGVRKTSEAYIVIEITDINDDKPDFTNCTSYAKFAKVLENQPVGTSVITVSATDGDRGSNGEVKYSISRSSLQPQSEFEIEERTGLVTTAQIFNREENRFFSLTVVGHDGGNPSQEGYCTFRVYIEDVNDNPPKFDQSEYKATIPQSFGYDRSVITIRATDIDAGGNAEISYFIVPNGDSPFFKIDPDVGIIRLNKTAMKSSFSLTVMAKDHGIEPLNSTVKVTISVANLTSVPPTWDKLDYDSSPYTVEETAERGTRIASFSARSNVDNSIVSFALIDENGYPKDNISPFNLIREGNTVTLAVYGPMAYKIKNSYQLRLRATNRGAIPLSSEIHPIINLNDTNNEPPVFYGLDKQSGFYPGSVAENMIPGQTVIQIKAEDLDSWWPNNKLTYELRDPPNAENVSKKFYLQVDPLNNNSVVVKSAVKFDREAIVNSKLYVDIWVKDGAPSSIKNDGTPNTALRTIEVTITDMNDNDPYFPQPFYNATVKEDATTGSKIITVKAEDIDSAANLVYSISGGNVRNAFKVQEKSGLIMVGRQLDYESSIDPKVYQLEMTVNDGLHTNRTQVFIHIEDVNDNPPMFTQDPYLVNDVVEEDPNISPSNKRYLLTVSATDADISRPTKIRYALMGSESKDFEINSDTGELYLLNRLDRDQPNGKALYQFNVRAQDEDIIVNYGYTAVEVRPIDINDNKPYSKATLEGKVFEHSKHGTPVMNVVFGDFDEGRNGTQGLSYDFVAGESDGQNLMFSIDKNGLIRTNTNADNLDRETTAEYRPTIVVRDDGPGLTRKSQEATLRIVLADINDQKPVFQRKIYQVEMSENQKSGQIARVVATDADIGVNCNLEYSLVSGAAFFRIDTVNNEGSIIVVQAVDYEYPDKKQQFFNITVKVQDPDPMHTDIAYVELTVLDFNDNIPQFKDPLQTKEVFEDIPVGTSIAYFSASDKDSGVNKEFTFSIDRRTDPGKLFSISQVGNEGNVSIRRHLDRETLDLHVLHILAIDKGDPALTGTATLSVTVKDINDNAPIFAGDYHPVVMENDKNYPKLVIKVNGTDLDASPYGPPFGFADLCPSHPVCAFFSLKFEPDGDGRKGWALVSTKTEYDREKTKFYYMPIVMWDMRGHQDAATKAKTGTNTLTIEIGDENDNKHGPGHKEIFVYNYKGMFGDIEIGNVYATDPDDWDRVDKDYIYTGPEYMKKYFTIDLNTGIITMQKGVPSENSPYTFTVRVVDNHWQGLAADCSVTVTIQDLSEEAVYNSGAVRLTGITAEEFVDRKKTPNTDIQEYDDSKLDVFRKLLADKLQVPILNVDIISIMNNGKFTDVRYTVHGSPYYPSERTNTILALHKKEFEDTVGIKIAMVPIDECRDEVFEGGCYNFLNVTGKPNLINTNGTSLIGVETFVQAKQGCRASTFPPVQECFATYCLNGGVCKRDDWGELSCDCLPGFNGPRCQQTRHSFDGKSYSLFETLEQCEEGQTSIYIITTKENGLIMYNGPAGSLGPDDPRDFMSLELLDGYPKLRIDHGTGELMLYVDGRDTHKTVIMQKLSDGKWHRIDIIRTGRKVEMIVDHCEAATLSNGVTTDDGMCRKYGVTPGENIFLNVDTLLHLGGTYVSPPYPGGLQQAKFDGCVKNLMHNGMMYDLTVKQSPDYPSGKPGCSREDDICGINRIEGPLCGENGICEASWNPAAHVCICKPTWRGLRCNTETTTKDMLVGSYFEWHLNNNFYNRLLGAGDWKLQLHIMFRTRDKDGVLLTVSSADSSQVITLQIIKKRLTLTYNLDGTNRNLELYYKDVSNGQWHTVEMQRFGLEFILKMDNGEGRNYNSTRTGTKEEMKISTTVHAGAILSQSSGVTVVDKDLAHTCVNDIRMNNRYFPMQYNENDPALAAELKKNPNVADGCHRDDCANVACPPPEVCVPLWNLYACRCPTHYERVNGICQPIVYCKDHQCFSGSTCVEDTSDVKGYRCDCPPGWSGDFCNRLSEAYAEAGITTGAIAAIVISVFVLLLLALAVILLVKCGKPKKADDKYILEVDSYDDIRENVINYDEEGAGEEDQEGYDMSRLRKPEDAHSLYKPPLDPMLRRDMPLSNAPGESPDVGNFINDRLGDADEDGGAPPYDSVREFAYEGVDSDAGSLSSLNTTSSTRSQDYDYLNDWGPKFAKLADMYGAGQEPEDD